jgi:hypothetical protein
VWPTNKTKQNTTHHQPCHLPPPRPHRTAALLASAASISTANPSALSESSTYEDKCRICDALSQGRALPTKLRATYSCLWTRHTSPPPKTLGGFIYTYDHASCVGTEA